MVVYICNPSYSGGSGRRVMSWRPGQAKIAAKTCLQNKFKKKIIEGLGV
jgi:hypothetical protein